MKIILIRHGATQGNIEKRYIGTSDEDILQSSAEDIKSHCYPSADTVFASPRKRCLQTAELIYGKCNIEKAFSEIDFGDFEGKTYKELSANADYQKWVDSNCTLPIPNGESLEIFQKRCVEAFIKCVSQHSHNKSIAFVVHGGTIMALLGYFSNPESNYFDWKTSNGGGYMADFNGKRLENISLLW